MKKKFVIHFTVEGEMLKEFEKDMVKNKGKLPQTLSKILEERYDVKDTISRGHTFIRLSKGIKTEISKDGVVKRFETADDVCDFLICSRTKLDNRLNKEAYKGVGINGWQIKRLK